MKAIRIMLSLFFVAALLAGSSDSAPSDAPPISFDLRDVNGENFVTSVKSQSGGTCWTHGVMASIEGNLLMTGLWASSGETGEPALAEYHLDWWNGFNQHNNDDTNPPTGGGLTVHQGGDYLVSAAYLARGEGAVRDVDGQSYNTPPLRSDPSYHYFYVREIEWFVAGADLSNIDTIKEKVMVEGVMGTCLCSSSSYINGEYEHYQPPSTSDLPNHAVAIIGWDDNRVTQAPNPGAWLCKNSWGSGWGYSGYFWISYYDKWCGQEPFMGAVSLHAAEPLAYDNFYYHDYHGWRDTKEDASEAFNAFTLTGGSTGFESVVAVSFCTAADAVTYTVKIYDDFSGGVLQGEFLSQTGTFDYRGFHTVDLDTPLSFNSGEDIYVYVELSDGGHAYDCTSDVPVLLGSSGRVIVESASNPGESFYMSGVVWEDLYAFNDTANFCIKALTVEEAPLNLAFPEGRPEGLAPPGAAVPVVIEITDGYEVYIPGTGTLHYRYDSSSGYTDVVLTPLGNDLYGATLPAPSAGDEPEYYFSAQGSGGSTAYAPAGAPGTVYSFDVGIAYTVFHDDCESDMGWTVENINLTTGAWERCVPNYTSGDQVAPLEDNPAGTGTYCFVTANGPAGGSYSDYDIDGGPTRLISPTIDLSAGDARISAFNWYYSRDGNDPYEIDVSNDNGTTWTNVYSSYSTLGDWTEISFIVSDHVTPTAQVKVRFCAQDQPNDDIVEAGVDDFRIELIASDPSLYADAYSISTSTGCDIAFSLDAGSAYGSRNYFIAGSMSGVYPGTTLPGGLVMPLNRDWVSDYILSHMTAPAFVNFFGSLDGNGAATAGLDLLGPGLAPYVGQTLNFAFTMSGTFDYASNPIFIEIEP